MVSDGVFLQVFSDDVVDRLAILAGVDIDASAVAAEVIHGGQSFCFEGVKSQLQAVRVVVAAARVFGSAENSLLQNIVRAFEVQHFGQLFGVAKCVVPGRQVRKRSGESVQ